MGSRTAKVVLLSLSFFTAGRASLALSPDSRLLQLVPPGSEVVAGMRAPTERGLPNFFVLITSRNQLDFEDFNALIGGDTTRSIREAIFISRDYRHALAEHSLLVSGTFNRESIFRFADGVRATRHEYRGIPVLMVRPFERERQFLNDVRSLAILDAKLAIFGTTASVQLELDRYLNNSQVDASLVERLQHLDKKNDCWSVVTGSMPLRRLNKLFGSLDPELASLVVTGELFQFGISLGSRVTLEYEVIQFFRPSSAQTVESSLDIPHTGQSLIDASRITDTKTTRGVVKVPRHRYEEWLNQVTPLTFKKNSPLS